MITIGWLLFVGIIFFAGFCGMFVMAICRISGTEGRIDEWREHVLHLQAELNELKTTRKIL